MKKSIKISLAWAFGVVTAAFTFVPESFFGIVKWISEETLASAAPLQRTVSEINIIISRVIVFLLVWAISLIIYLLFQKYRRSVDIKGNNYTIRVEYGYLFEAENCKRVISFDECFSTNVGDGPGDIKKTSICGQYLTLNPGIDIQKLIKAAKLKPTEKKSEFEQRPRYQSGSIVPNGDDLLMAFAPLDESGRGVFSSRDEYIACLSKLWREIDKHYGQKDVCIPLLGAGLTRFDSASGASYSAQELLDIIIQSYKLSSNRIKLPYKLRIVWKRSDDLSISQIVA